MRTISDGWIEMVLEGLTERLSYVIAVAAQSDTPSEGVFVTRAFPETTTFGKSDWRSLGAVSPWSVYLTTGVKSSQGSQGYQ